MTPFRPGLWTGVLSAILTALIRLAGFNYNRNLDAGILDRNNPLVNDAVSVIEQRDQRVTGKKDAGETARRMLEHRLDHWRKQIDRSKQTGAKVGYTEKTAYGKASPQQSGVWIMGPFYLPQFIERRGIAGPTDT